MAGLGKLERLKMVLRSEMTDITVRTMGELEEQGQAFALVFQLPPKQTQMQFNPAQVSQTFKQPQPQAQIDLAYVTRSIKPS